MKWNTKHTEPHSNLLFCAMWLNCVLIPQQVKKSPDCVPAKKQTMSSKLVMLFSSMHGNKDVSLSKGSWPGCSNCTYLTRDNEGTMYVVMTPEPPETVRCGALWLYEKAKTSTSRDQNEGTNPICSIPLQWPLRFQSHILLTSLEVFLKTKLHLQSFLHANTHAQPHHKPLTL